MRMDKVSVVGLGKLGLCLAACMAERGFYTIGVDVEEGTVKQVNKGVAPFYEPGLDRILEKHGGKNLIASIDHKEAIENTDITFILVRMGGSQIGMLNRL